MTTNDVNLQVINSMTQEQMQSLKDSSGKIPSLANQLIMTDEEDANLSQLRTEVVYDRSSPDTSKNWTITVGIKGGIVTGHGDFTKYERIKVTAWNYDTTITYFIDLINPTPKEITSGYPYSGCGQVLSPNNITEEHYSFSAVSSDKKEFYHYKAGYIKDTTDYPRQENAQYVVTKIEGYLKEPAMIYTGDELYDSDTVTIKNGVINAGQTYSTTEQFTGNYWIDGKPIYRKCVITNTPSALDTWTSVLTISSSKVTILRVDGTVKSTTTEQYTSPVTYYCNGYNLFARITNDYHANKPLYIIVEYIKEYILA